MKRFIETLKELKQYPSALIGLLLIATLVFLSIYTVISIPYGQALDRWRGGAMWSRNPVNAMPIWLDRVTGGNKPKTIIVNSQQAVEERSDFTGGAQIRIPLQFNYNYDDFPSEINLFLNLKNTDQAAFVRLSWVNSLGENIVIGGQKITGAGRISISQNRNLESRLGVAGHIGLFNIADLSSSTAKVGSGNYTLLLETVLFGNNPQLEAELVLYGRVYGLAGTDHERRDLMLALLWGTPVALAFGLLAAVGSTVTTLVIAAAGVWLGGWIDAAIQRLTEVNMILPTLPILVMVGTMYSTSIWLMLGVVILMGIFSAGIKMYRAMLLPIKQAAYIEAARAYGASNTRIILRYMIPRILPILIPTFVTLIPSFVFLEASLAVLGLGDPVLPTWGKILNDAQDQSALYNGYYYWVIAPALLLMITGLGFAMLGFALDRVVNPRLRTQ